MAIGYDSKFIGDGIVIPLPKFNRSLAQSVLRRPNKLREGLYSDHLHFTLVMNEHTRQLIYSAYNIDQSQFRKVAGSRSWRNDKNIGKSFQLGNEYYKDRKTASDIEIPNPYDKGHMVMRFNNTWGANNEEADKAGKATYIYANASLQHENLNRDEWKALEINIVRNFQHNTSNKLTVFTGPIYGDLDRHINLTDQNTARIPSGFFKVICFRSKHEDDEDRLGVLAFAIFQDAKVLRDRKGSATVKTDRRYQVTISELQDWTGINFGKQLYDRNPLFYHDITARNKQFNIPIVPERIPVGQSDDIVVEHDEIRCDIETLSERKIIINFAMIDPKGNEQRGEWVSLYNRTNRKINLLNWKLVDGHGREVILSDSINSGESIRLKGKSLGKIKLSNTGGSLMLHDDHECIIDHVTWSKHEMKRLDEGLAFMFNHE